MNPIRLTLINSPTLETKLGIQGLHGFIEFLILKHSIDIDQYLKHHLKVFMQEPMLRIQNRISRFLVICEKPLKFAP